MTWPPRDYPDYPEYPALGYGPPGYSPWVHSQPGYGKPTKVEDVPVGNVGL